MNKGGQWWLSGCRTAHTGATASRTFNHERPSNRLLWEHDAQTTLVPNFYQHKWLLSPAIHKLFPSNFVNIATLLYHCHLDICLQKKTRDLPLDIASLLQAYTYWKGGRISGSFSALEQTALTLGSKATDRHPSR